MTSFNSPRSVRLILIMILMGILALSASAFADDPLTIADSTTIFRHFAFTLDEYHRIKTADPNTIVDQTFATKVIENSTLRVTLLPEFGGRILSIIYKPTGHELLYQNPVGTPFGIGDKSFYYDWLMVYGGIFPTFPEPEHGKTWCLPWDYRIVEQTPEKIAVEMRFTDHIKPVQDVTPWSFSNGETGITCIATVTVYRDRSYVQLNLQTINNGDEPVKYEYWTCTTLAPGSEPGKTYCPGNTEIIAPVRQVKLKDNSWPWMGQTEQDIDPMLHTFVYDKLAFFENWRDMGIAYASPFMDKEWWGVINHTNEEGILRIADNKRFTPGMKFWTWGYKASQAANPENFYQQKRPYIELWAGHSREFFTPSVMEAHGRKNWDEFYFPTVGLPQITYANPNGAVYLSYRFDKDRHKYYFDASLFTTRPGESLQLNMALSGKKTVRLLNQSFSAGRDKADSFRFETAENQIPADASAYEINVTTPDGKVLIHTAVPFRRHETSRP